MFNSYITHSGSYLGVTTISFISASWPRAMTLRKYAAKSMCSAWILQDFFLIQHCSLCLAIWLWPQSVKLLKYGVSRVRKKIIPCDFYRNTLSFCIFLSAPNAWNLCSLYVFIRSLALSLIKNPTGMESFQACLY